MAYIDMVYVVMGYLLMGYIVMAYTVMTLYIEREGENSKLGEIKLILDGHYDDQSAVQVEWFFMCPELREELQKAGYWRDAAVMQVRWLDRNQLSPVGKASLVELS